MTAAPVTWAELATSRPDLAAEGRRLLYQFEIGLGFLATVRADHGPRVHPICPVLTDDALYGLIVPGPKLADLRRDPRYALHSETSPPPRHDDAFYLTGVVREMDDAALAARVGRQMLDERHLETPWPGFDAQVLVEFLIDRVLLTLTTASDVFPAGHTVWTP